MTSPESKCRLWQPQRFHVIQAEPALFSSLIKKTKEASADTGWHSDFALGPLYT